MYDQILASYYALPQIDDMIESASDFELYITFQIWLNLFQINVATM